MLIEKIDDVGPESLQRGFGNLLDVLGPAIEPGLLASCRVKMKAKLRSDYHVSSDGRSATRGDDPCVDASPVEPAENSSVLDLYTAIHHDIEAGE